MRRSCKYTMFFFHVYFSVLMSMRLFLSHMLIQNMFYLMKCATPEISLHDFRISLYIQYRLEMTLLDFTRTFDKENSEILISAKRCIDYYVR